jgi:hypothetical protein
MSHRRKSILSKEQKDDVCINTHQNSFVYKAVEIPTDLKTSIATLCFPRFSINTSSSLLQNSFLISQQFLYFILICANKTEKFSFLPFSTAAEAAIAALQRKREIKLTQDAPRMLGQERKKQQVAARRAIAECCSSCLFTALGTGHE